eukprot:TRINITY_DN973_c0_g1_i2.p1 TRINITY_DN973_c0_g1~~TRINITY_DN973_c0_g1_i2.p1  ORF type:complete len:198 (-),score=15.39 TRINITY_DN973_c0_g1_i2:87-680(-)
MTNDRTIVKTIIIGDSGVGKTSLMHTYVNGRFIQQYKSNIAYDFCAKEVRVSPDFVFCAQLWDTAGQERFEAISSHYYRHMDCCILVYDVDNAASFQHLERWYEEVRKRINEGDTVIFGVIGNKIDKQNRAVSTSEASGWCLERSIPFYFETSALASTNVAHAFETILKKAAMSLKQDRIILEEDPTPIPSQSYCSC